MRQAHLVYSTPPCWWRCRKSQKRNWSPAFWCFGCYISWSHFASLSLSWRAGNPSCSCAVTAWRLRNEGPNLQKRRSRRRTKTSRRIQGWVEHLRNPLGRCHAEQPWLGFAEFIGGGGGGGGGRGGGGGGGRRRG